MLTQHLFLLLFQKFITDSYRGKRLNSNGARIKEQSVDNYISCQKLLIDFSKEKNFALLIYEVKGQNKRDHLFLKRYYTGFYTSFTQYMYKEKNCYDNYVGQTIKQIRVFFAWLNREAGIPTGLYYKNFYVLRQEIPIITLSVNQLKYLMHDEAFEQKLTPALKQCKDIFVFGCLVGLRYSDLCSIKQTNLCVADGAMYLKVKSKKTGTETSVKLPAIAVAIVQKYKHNRKKPLPFTNLNGFNAQVKQIAEQAGWTYPVSVTRTKQGLFKRKQPVSSAARFCDCISSHIMRRTCITIMLTSGMPELIVKKISGHSNSSRSFYSYVNFAQEIVDQEIEKMHRNFE
jgi:integrase